MNDKVSAWDIANWREHFAKLPQEQQTGSDLFIQKCLNTIEALKWSYEEGIRQYNHQQERACNAEADLKEANGFIDDLANFLFAVNDPHDTNCTHYRNENKPCDCEYDNLANRFTEHCASLEKGRE